MHAGLGFQPSDKLKNVRNCPTVTSRSLSQTSRGMRLGLRLANAVRHFLWPISPEIGVRLGAARGLVTAATLPTLDFSLGKCFTALPAPLHRTVFCITLSAGLLKMGRLAEVAAFGRGYGLADKFPGCVRYAVDFVSQWIAGDIRFGEVMHATDRRVSLEGRVGFQLAKDLEAEEVLIELGVPRVDCHHQSVHGVLPGVLDHQSHQVHKNVELLLGARTASADPPGR